MVKKLACFIHVALIVGRSFSKTLWLAAGLSGWSSLPSPVCFVSPSALLALGGTPTRRSSIAEPLTTTNNRRGFFHSDQRYNDQRVNTVRPGKFKMMSASTAFAPPAAAEEVERPADVVELNSIDFNPGVRATGPGALTPVVILHGLLGNSRNFQGWGTKLVKSLEQERRVFAVDLRNHGASPHHDSMSYADMADDVLGFLADQGLSKAVLIGHSLGGKVAAMMALLHPHAVKGVVIMDIAPVTYSIVDATNWGETQKIIQAIKEMPLGGLTSRKDAKERLAKDVVHAAFRAFVVTNLFKDPATEAWAWRINIDSIHRSMEMLAQFGSRKDCREEGGLGQFSEEVDVDELQAYNGDALFVAAGNSRYIRSQHLPEIRKFFPTFVLSTVKGAGHCIHADNPTETLRLTKLFLDRPELG